MPKVVIISDLRVAPSATLVNCIVSVGTELVIWLYRTHVRSYNLAAGAGIAVSFVSMLICS